MTKTPETFPDPEMPKIIPDTVFRCPNTDLEMTNLEKKNIDEAILQRMRKKDLYETYI